MITISETINEEIYKNAIAEFEKCELLTFENFDFKSLTKECGIVYKFYTVKEDKLILKYIGKSTWKYFKTRLKSHFEGIGKGTQSKYRYIKTENINKDKVYFKFIETNPIYLRNYIEEMLIERFNTHKELWNYKH